MTVRHVAIVGGGIAGLATAYYLEKRAREGGRSLRCTLVEASDRLGGKVVTTSAHDFIVEGGPDSFVTDKPQALALCHELGLGGDLIPSNQRTNKIYMVRGGRLVEFPAGVRLAIPTRILPFLQTSLISWPGKFRMGLEALLPARPAEGDESVGQFIGRRFGREAVELFGGPLMAGIYVSDPDRLSMQSSFPRFLEMEKKYGSLIRGARKMKHAQRPARAGPVPAGGAMFNALKGGMGQLIETLAATLTCERRLATAVSGMRCDGASWKLSLDDGQELMADEVVLAIPARGAARLLAEQHPALSAALADIRFVSTATVSLAYLEEDLPENRPLDGLGVVMPAGEGRKIIACTWASTKFRHRAPPGAVLLRAFVGGYRDEALAEQDEEALVAMVRDEFASLFGIHAKPMLVEVFRWPKGNPQYDVGHLDRTERMEAMAAELPGLHLAGSSYHGVGLPDCIKSALRVVDRIAG